MEQLPKFEGETIEDSIYSVRLPSPHDYEHSGDLDSGGIVRDAYSYTSDSVHVALAKYTFPPQLTIIDAEMARAVHEGIVAGTEKKNGNIRWDTSGYELMDSTGLWGHMAGFTADAYITIDYYRRGHSFVQLMTHCDTNCSNLGLAISRSFGIK